MPRKGGNNNMFPKVITVLYRPVGRFVIHIVKYGAGVGGGNLGIHLDAPLNMEIKKTNKKKTTTIV